VLNAQNDPWAALCADILNRAQRAPHAVCAKSIQELDRWHFGILYTLPGRSGRVLFLPRLL
jgi:hypothetical protein